jgi:hypothetical protein
MNIFFPVSIGISVEHVVPIEQQNRTVCLFVRELQQKKSERMDGPKVDFSDQIICRFFSKYKAPGGPWRPWPDKG